MVFCDITTVSVTGQTDLEDDVRAYGLAKSGLIERPFMLSLVQTAEGLPIAHEYMCLIGVACGGLAVAFC